MISLSVTNFVKQPMYFRLGRASRLTDEAAVYVVALVPTAPANIALRPFHSAKLSCVRSDAIRLVWAFVGEVCNAHVHSGPNGSHRTLNELQMILTGH